jgi:hypothetical protein
LAALLANEDPDRLHPAFIQLEGRSWVELFLFKEITLKYSINKRPPTKIITCRVFYMEI